MSKKTAGKSELTEEQRLLDAFLVDNRELETLTARLSEFNLFNVLRIENAEIRHSNVLAWLLTPGETHGLGETFLRRFLSRLLMENQAVDVHMTPAQIELMMFDDIEVEREWQNIDILARSRSGNWCLLIENKIHSKEKKGALRRYREVLERDMPGAEIIPVLLTLDGEDPSTVGKEAGFISRSHVDVLELADTVVTQHAARIPPDAATFLNHYLSTLRRITMQDEQLVELCRTIYRKHRKAIDLIIEFGKSSRVTDAVQEFVTDTVDCEFVFRRSRMVWFVPTALGQHLPAVPLSAWGHLPHRVPISFWFSSGPDFTKLQLVLEVGPIADAAMRIALLKAAKNAGFKFWEKTAFQESGKFTRILSQTRKLRTTEDGEPDDDPDYIKSVAQSLWSKVWSETEPLIDVVKRFDWKAGS